MKDLYKYIEESILSNDEKITQDMTGEEATARFHYDLFMNYVGDLLYKKAPYQNFLSSGEINFLIKDQKTFIDVVYNNFTRALNKYFQELQRIHKDKKISWNKKNVMSAQEYQLKLQDTKTKEEQTVIFKVCNRRDNRLIQVFTPINKPFMKP